MAMKIEIPDLFDPYLMELSVCGRIGIKDKKSLSILNHLYDNPLIGIVNKSSTYAEVFGGGEIKNHLHVNIVIRPPSWAQKQKFRPLSALQSALGNFLGVGGRFRIRGEFLVEKSDLPKDGFIRAAMKRTEVVGIRATRLGETYALESEEPYSQFRWMDFGKGYILAILDIESSMKIEADYLLKSKSAIVWAFRRLISRSEI
jgi:hypothetical protein